MDSRQFHRINDEKIDQLVSRGFSYSRKLLAHKSCVNALAWSSGEGRWLASGGDDLEVCLWDMVQEDLRSPSFSCAGPTSNILALTWSATNQHIYAGGADNLIIKYDSSRMEIDGQNPFRAQSYNDHFDSVRAITPHPFHDEVFMSGGEDGKIILYDTRAPWGTSQTQSTLQLESEVTGLSFHPTMDHIFATSDHQGEVCLRDTRMAFGPLRQRHRVGKVRKFVTLLSGRSRHRICNPELRLKSTWKDDIWRSLCLYVKRYARSSVLVIHSLCQYQHFRPVIYSLTDSYPIAMLSGTQLPDGRNAPADQRTYSNSCTMKHGSFGGFGSSRDSFYAAGSDDFRGYVWKIPEEMVLKDARCTVDLNAWEGSESDGSDPNEFGFTRGDLSPRVVPRTLSRPCFRLTGHKSIVNTAMCHPRLPYIATAGIESYVRLHSPTPQSYSCSDLLETETDTRELPEPSREGRQRYMHALIGNAGFDEEEEATDDLDGPAVALFDEILRMEGEANPFDTRGWSPDEDAIDDVDSDDLYT